MQSPRTDLVVRSSCDACSAAKVRCDKTRPQCLRCQKDDRQCVYGVSNKHGRLETRRLRAASRIGGQRIAKSTPQCLSHSVAPYLDGDRTTKPWQQRQSSLLNGFDSHTELVTTPASPESLVAGIESYHGGDWSVPLYQEHAAMLARTLATMNPPSKWSYLPLELGSMQPPSNDEAESKSTAQEDSGSCWHGMPLQHQGLATPPVSVRAEASIHCYDLARATLDDLQCDQVRAPLDLDHLLRVNRNSDSTLRFLLACECAGEPHQATMYGSIAAGIISRYRLAGSALRSPRQNGSIGISVPPETCPSPNYWVGSAVASIDSLPATIGSIELDTDNRARLDQQLLYNELRHTSTLIDAFENVRNLATTPEAETAEHLMMPYETIGAWLRSQWTDAVSEFRLAGCQ